MKTKHSDDDLKLRSLLTRGDPADGEEALEAQDLARMRREILAQAEGGEPSVSRVYWRWAAAFVCVLVLAVVGWQLRKPSVRPSGETEIAGARETATADATTPLEAPPPEVVDEPRVTVASAKEEPVDEAVDEPAEILQARTLRFTTRRGTQIIWILDPELEL